MLKMIYAIGPNKEFGYADGLPWENAPGDLPHFKEYTKDCVLLMSGATFKSLPGRLKDRPHAIIGRYDIEAKNGDSPDVSFSSVSSLENAYRSLQIVYPEKDIVVIGGRKLLTEAAEFVDEVSISRIKEEFVTAPSDDNLIIFDDSKLRETLWSRDMHFSVEEKEFGGLTTGHL